jgi:hypothetical protein
MSKSRRLRDIRNFGPCDLNLLQYLQLKVSAAGEMKSAIKRLADEREDLPGGQRCIVSTKCLREALGAMEHYLNLAIPETEDADDQ